MKGLWVVAAVCSLAACTDDADEGRGDTLRLLTYVPTFQEVPASRAVTVPEGCQPFGTFYPGAATELPAIGVFLTPKDATLLQSFQYNANGTWDSSIRVKEESYYVYGYYPQSCASSASVTPLSGDYATGAVLHLAGVPTLTTIDPCVTVGIQGATSSSADVTLAPGSFLYATQPKGHNYLYMLFDHLYAALQFSIRVDATYATLRTIHLKSLALQTTGANATDIDVTLAAGAEALTLDDVTYTSLATTGAELPMFTATGTGTVLTTEYQGISGMACFLPSLRSNLTLVSTYDVYDRKGNLVREGCRAVNALILPPSISRGQRNTIRLTVNPTYLYQLSDPELDNPTITIES